MRIALLAPIALTSALLAGPALAQSQEWYTGARDPKQATSYGAAIDTSLTGTSRGSIHGSVIGTIAPFTKMDETGVRLRLGGLLGQYTYVSISPGVGEVKGTEASGSLMAGYEWVSTNATFAIFLGGEFQNRRLDKNDPSNSVIGNKGGMKASVDFHVTPTSYTMVAGTISYSTNNNAYYSRFKAGMKISENMYLGPELLFLGDNFYGQWRAGAHLTGAKFGALQFGVSGGYVNDRRAGSGVYGILDARVGF